MKLLQSEHPCSMIGKRSLPIIGFKMSSVFGVSETLLQSSSKADWSCTISLMPLRELKRTSSVIGSHTEAMLCLFDRTGDIIWTSTDWICMQLRNKITEVRNVGLCQPQSTKHSSSQFRGYARNIGKKQHRIKQPGKAIGRNLHGIPFIWTFGAAWTQSYINCR